VKSATGWLEYYHNNAASLLDIPWEIGSDLTAEEETAIRQSLREFQAGERSEGHHLIANAREYVERSGDAFYLETIHLFIAEEQRHARDLGRFLTMNDIPLVPTTLTDTVFRKLRNLLPSLELSIGVLITAEIIAKVYYAALREATKSIVLRRICDQILYDELSHVAFQSDQLYRLRSGRKRMRAVLTMALQRFLFWGTVLVVWLFHRPVMQRAGIGFTDWWQSCWDEFNEAFANQEPGRPTILK
jgi:hypothetical protein